MKEYVEERNGGLYVIGTRVSLDSIVYQFRMGLDAETILLAYPGLGSLENVYGSIAYYLANRTRVDDYLRRQQAEYDEACRRQQSLSPGLQDRLGEARERMLTGPA